MKDYKIILATENDRDKAIRCYATFCFNVVGECFMYDQDFLCYEKEL